MRNPSFLWTEIYLLSIKSDYQPRYVILIESKVILISLNHNRSTLQQPKIDKILVLVLYQKIHKFTTLIVMDPTAPIIKQMTQLIQKNMQQLSSSLDKKYGTILQRIESKRFECFQKCLKQKSDIPQCYEQVQRYHVNVDFPRANKQFQDCVQTIPTDYFDTKVKKENNFVESKVNSCTLKYESVVVTDMDKEIKRLNKLF